MNTPRTNERRKKISEYCGSEFVVSAVFVQDLETELIAEKEKVKELMEVLEQVEQQIDYGQVDIAKAIIAKHREVKK